MIKHIWYFISVTSLDFSNSNFLSYKVELIPRIIVEVRYGDDTIKDIVVFYTRNGFVVELNSQKISNNRGKELEHYLNRCKKFKNDFDEFMDHLKTHEKAGFVLDCQNSIDPDRGELIEENNI